ncbi:MAG: helix-turn-helix domain-containing protein, partial [Betaproteobacteria bacterium]|nr:helix-turn-helix domain-containing protein [Betaproteobacteria bacterium]
MKSPAPPRTPSPAEVASQGLGAPAEAGRLGAFVRAARERVRPQELGLPQGHRRRTQGLRREEVAALCGISPTWYTWIEQGRTHAVSVSTLDALARGLRLSVAERAYLFR